MPRSSRVQPAPSGPMWHAACHQRGKTHNDPISARVEPRPVRCPIFIRLKRVIKAIHHCIRSVGKATPARHGSDGRSSGMTSARRRGSCAGKLVRCQTHWPHRSHLSHPLCWCVHAAIGGRHDLAGSQGCMRRHGERDHAASVVLKSDEPVRSVGRRPRLALRPVRSVGRWRQVVVRGHSRCLDC